MKKEKKESAVKGLRSATWGNVWSRKWTLDFWSGKYHITISTAHYKPLAYCPISHWPTAHWFSGLVYSFMCIVCCLCSDVVIILNWNIEWFGVGESCVCVSREYSHYFWGTMWVVFIVFVLHVYLSFSICIKYELKGKVH